MSMARTEDYIIMPKNQYFSVYFYGHFISNCDTIKEAEQEIQEHIEQNTGKENRTT